MSSFVKSIEPFEEILEAKDPKDLRPREREILYSAAYNFYQIGEHGKGADLFTKLVLHFPFEPRFWKGLASCRQMLCDYKAALKAWSLVALLGGNPSGAHFHAAECYLSLGEKEEAKTALNAAAHFLKGDEPHSLKLQELRKSLSDG